MSCFLSFLCFLCFFRLVSAHALAARCISCSPRYFHCQFPISLSLANPIFPATHPCPDLAPPTAHCASTALRAAGPLRCGGTPTAFFGRSGPIIPPHCPHYTPIHAHLLRNTRRSHLPLPTCALLSARHRRPSTPAPVSSTNPHPSSGKRLGLRLGRGGLDLGLESEAGKEQNRPRKKYTPRCTSPPKCSKCSKIPLNTPNPGRLPLPSASSLSCLPSPFSFLPSSFPPLLWLGIAFLASTPVSRSPVLRIPQSFVLLSSHLLLLHPSLPRTPSSTTL